MDVVNHTCCSKVHRSLFAESQSSGSSWKLVWWQRPFICHQFLFNAHKHIFPSQLWVEHLIQEAVLMTQMKRSLLKLFQSEETWLYNEILSVISGRCSGWKGNCHFSDAITPSPKTPVWSQTAVTRNCDNYRRRPSTAHGFWLVFWLKPKDLVKSIHDILKMIQRHFSIISKPRVRDIWVWSVRGHTRTSAAWGRHMTVSSVRHNCV